MAESCEFNLGECVQPQSDTHIMLHTLEPLVEIFSHLGTRQDLISCSLVSKAFYAAAICPSLWKPLCYKIWRISENHGENWKKCYGEMYMKWGQYEHCYANIRKAWDLIEKYTSEFCPTLLHGLNDGATEEELNQAEKNDLHGTTLPDDYRCFLRIHNGQKNMNRPSVLGTTHIANHFKREALLNVKTATMSLAHMNGGLRGCIPITLCVANKCGHYMAVNEEASHKYGRVFWPSLDNETVNLGGGGRMHCFLMADNFSEWFTSYAENLVKESYPVIRGEIFPFKSASQHTSDNGITVKTATCFLPELSSVSPPRFFFTYRITILMDQSFPKGGSCKLETRHWYITDGNGEKEEVHGDAVVGQYPTMVPGARHDYVSCTSFTTPTGTMEGHYTFQFLNKAGTTNAKIAPMHFVSPPFEFGSARQQRCNEQLNEDESCTDAKSG